MKKFCLLVVALFFTIFPALCLGQEYPTQPITMVVGYAPGGMSDTGTRMICEEAKKNLGVEILIQNKPGASATVGVSYVMTAKPDGYILGGTGDTPFLRAPHMLTLNFDPIKDTLPLVYYATNHNFIVVREDSPFKTFTDLINFAKENPGKLTYGSPGLGTTLYLSFAGVAHHLGLKFSSVMFSGDAPTLLAVLGGHVMAAGISAGPCMPQIKAGKVRPLAVTDGTKRIGKFPQVPVLHEFVTADYVIPPFGLLIFGPKGLPGHVVDKIEDVFSRAANSEGFKKWAEGEEVYPLQKPYTGKDLQNYLETEYKRMGNLIDKLGVKPKK